MALFEEIKTSSGLTDRQLRSLIEQDSYSQLAKLIDKCDELLDQREFNLANCDKEKIKKLSDNQEKVQHLLSAWKLRTNPTECRFDVLIKILLRGKQGNVAIKIAEYLQTKGECSVNFVDIQWL